MCHGQIRSASVASLLRRWLCWRCRLLNVSVAPCCVACGAQRHAEIESLGQGNHASPIAAVPSPLGALAEDLDQVFALQDAETDPPDLMASSTAVTPRTPNPATSPAILDNWNNGNEPQLLDNAR